MISYALAAFLNNGWIEDLGTWLFGLIVGAELAHHHIIKPARRRHEELLAKHSEHADRLAALEQQVSK